MKAATHPSNRPTPADLQPLSWQQSMIRLLQGRGSVPTGIALELPANAEIPSESLGMESKLITIAL
jgi:hypothetical protein